MTALAAAWTIVIPVKGTSGAKSRLGASQPLALAIALDTVAATVSAAAAVARVIVVTPSEGEAPFLALGATIVADPGGGLAAAISSGLAAAHGPTGVLLGDLPALRPDELSAALSMAAAHPRAMVPDAAGVGTVLITAQDARAHSPAFGPNSHALHLAAGYVGLAVDAASGLRRDVDTRADLAALAGRLGPRTRALLPPGA